MKYFIAAIGLMCLATIYQSFLPSSFLDSRKDFSKIYVSDGLEVLLQKGDISDVKVEGSPEKVERVMVSYQGDKVSIVNKNKKNSKKGEDLRVTITYRELECLEAESAVSIRAKEPVVGTVFYLNLTSAVSCDLDLHVQEAKLVANEAVSLRLGLNAKKCILDCNSACSVDLKGEITDFCVKGKEASTIRFEGDSDWMELNLSEASTFKGNGICQKSKVSLSDASSAKLTVERELKIEELKNISSLRVLGNPAVEKSNVDKSSTFELIEEAE